MGVGVQTVFRSYRTISAEDHSGFYGRLLTHHISNVATQISTYLFLIDFPLLVDRNIDSQLHHAHRRCHNRSAHRGCCSRSCNNLPKSCNNLVQDPATTAIELTCWDLLCIESRCRPSSAQVKSASERTPLRLIWARMSANTHNLYLSDSRLSTAVSEYRRCSRSPSSTTTMPLLLISGALCVTH